MPAAELFDHHWLVDIEGLGTFETYPNRSSLRYLPHSMSIIAFVTDSSERGEHPGRWIESSGVNMFRGD